MNMMQMMQQAQNLQKKMKNVQDELSAMEVTEEVSGVKVICDGQGKFKSIKLSAEAINCDNPSSVSQETIEMLEDIISSAITKTSDKAHKIMEDKMKALTGGISIPGLF